MMLTFLTGRSYSTGDIDREIRRVDSFGTAPEDLKRYAESQGIPCGMYNNASIEEIKEHLRAGRGVMVALDAPYGRNSGGVMDHYVNVTGIVSVGGREFVRIRDPNGDDNPNATKYGGNGDYLMPMDDFLKSWGGKTIDGYHNFMMVYGREGDDLPADRLDGAEHSVAIASSYWNLRNNLDRVFSPDGLGSFARGAIGTIGAGVMLLPTGVGWVVSSVGNGIRNLADSMPFGLKQTGIVLALPFQMIGRAWSRIMAGYSNAFDRIGQSVEHLLDGKIAKAAESAVAGVGEAAAGIVHGAVDAGKAAVEAAKDVGGGIVDAANDAGKAVGDFFGF